jgi:hypothetical protein
MRQSRSDYRIVVPESKSAAIDYAAMDGRFGQ